MDISYDLSADRLNTAFPTRYELRELCEEMTTDALQRGDYDARIEQILITCTSKTDLQDLAYTLFTGQRKIANEPRLAMLSYMFRDPDIDLKDLVDALRFCFNKWKENFKPAGEASSVPKESPFTPPDIEPNAKILIHQGGGIRHLKAFLSESPNAGYKCNNFGWGIYVTPFTDCNLKGLYQADIIKLVLNSRSPLYARRTSIEEFDDPALFYGVIKAKDLVGTDRDYEAVLPVRSVSELKQYHVKPLSISLKDVGSNMLLTAGSDYVPKEFAGANADLILRLQASLRRIENS